MGGHGVHTGRYAPQPDAIRAARLLRATSHSAAVHAGVAFQPLDREALLKGSDSQPMFRTIQKVKTCAVFARNVSAGEHELAMRVAKDGMYQGLGFVIWW